MNYFEKIDGLRCLAIAFVLVEHFAPDVGHKITAGYYGVDLFFVISGFLITNILLNSKGAFLASYGKFVGRRTLRIFPLYYLTIGFMLAVGYEPCRESLLYLATYTFNYAWIRFDLPMGYLTHFWSLAVEEQFYLFWPFLVLSFRKRPRILFFLTGAIVSLCFYQLTTSYFEMVAPYNFVGLFPRAGSLCLGAIGAMLQRRRSFLDDLFKNILLEWMVLAGLAISLVTTYGLKFVVLGLCSLYLVLKSAHSDFSFGFINRFLTDRRVLHVGRISYGIYIFHVPIGLYLTDRFVAPWWYSVDFVALGRFGFVQHYLWVVLLPVYALLSIGLATLSSRYLERPILSLKDRLFR